MSLETIERRSLTALVRPYLARISEWQERGAYLRARLASGQANREERLAARMELLRMRAEVSKLMEEVRATGDGAAPTGRVRDVVLALERLEQQLAVAGEHDHPPDLTRLIPQYRARP